MFTSDRVINNELIVMVTNTGSDFGENHFNLQIPGSGWGLFNGCISQFPNNNSWDALYRHVSQRSDCDKLPTIVQAGCYWRFDWFQNADNPDVRFKQVLCPAALINKIIPATTSSISSEKLFSSYVLVSILFLFFLKLN